MTKYEAIENFRKAYRDYVNGCFFEKHDLLVARLHEAEEACEEAVGYRAYAILNEAYFNAYLGGFR